MPAGKTPQHMDSLPIVREQHNQNSFSFLQEGLCADRAGEEHPKHMDPKLPFEPRVKVLLFSAAKPLVMIAGVRCTLSTWTPDLLKNLAATREVVVFDNKGVGFSYDAEWPGDVSIQSYAESTVALISALELEEPDVLGWSMVHPPTPSGSPRPLFLPCL